jgi:SNF2 family DNA or RNA helicase
MKYRYKTKPYRHQHKALLRALKQHYLGVLWEPGLGKSKLIVDWAAAENMRGNIQRVLIVCPLSAVGVWEDEFKSHCPVPYLITSPDPKNEIIGRVKRLHIVVINYDLAWRRAEMIARFKPQFVIADESHRIKRASTRRSWYMRSWNKAPYRAILTGTPVPRSMLDLYGQWVFLNPKTFGTRIKDFKERYIKYGGFRGYQVKGYYHLKELKAKVKKDATRRRKDNTLDLPERIWQRVPVDLEPYASSLYWQVAEEFYAQLKSGEIVDVKNAMVKLGKLQQIAGGWVFTDKGPVQVSTAKLNATREILEDLYEAQDKVVVFARFLAEVNGIADVGRKIGFNTFVLSGATPRAQRPVDVRTFQRGTKPSLFVAQTQTGGLSITLTGAHEAIFYSPPLPLDDYIQCCDRVHRIGQAKKVRYRHIVARETVDLEIYQRLKDKREVMALIMGRPDVLRRGRTVEADRGAA